MTRPPTRADLLRSRAQAFARTVPRVRAGDPRGVHRLRVAARRLRELVPVLGLDAGRSRRLSRALRQVSQALGDVRELDVLSALLADTRPAVGGAALDAARAVVEEARSRSRQRALTRELRGRLDRIVKRLDKTVRDVERTGPGVRRGLKLDLEARVARRARRVRETVESAGTVYFPERLHDVRVAIKKLRYALELLSEATGSVGAADLARLRTGQRLLGGLLDRHLLTACLRQLRDRSAAPQLAAWREIDELAAALEAQCRRAHARYVRSRRLLITVCERFVAAPAASTRRAG